MIVIQMIFAALIGMGIRYYLSENIIIKNNLINITFIINTISCFILGTMYYIITTNYQVALIILSFLGAFSTFSSFNYDLLTKINNSFKKGISFLIIQLLTSFLFLFIGYNIANLFVGV
ncbi:MAG: CrcB family protein [Erysipelotrichales bacterium]